ncbi:MAG TPA: hypothetical protein VGP43_02505 [Chitinophagaceae bacterium]|nr:hypothetical protein [Chitinophagaceae bacterium]
MARDGTKTGGRRKGSTNKIKSDLREKITEFLGGNFAHIKRTFMNLEPRDKMKFYTDLLQYGLPKLQATSLDFDLNQLSDKQLDQLFNKIIEAFKNNNAT